MATGNLQGAYASHVTHENSSPTSPNYTAALGRDRFDHCRAKNLIYQSTESRPNTPQKTGKRGPAGGLLPHQAPYATIDETGGSHKSHFQTTSVESSKPMSSPYQALAGPDSAEIGFDPKVYAANRLANQKIKEESARKNFLGNGAILSHPVADTASAKP